MSKLSSSTLRRRLALLLCVVSAFFLIAGNLPRMIPAIGGAINGGEVAWLLCICTLGLAFLGSALSVRALVAAVGACILSFVVGLSKFGFSGEAFAYNIRLCGHLVGGVVLARSLWHLYRDNYRALVKAIVVTYTVLALASFVLFAIFPDTSQLWKVMQDSGVDFQGDPHNGRLISPYFDPNFYSCIIVLPILLAWYTTSYWKAGWVCMAILVVSLLMTVSRSGMALLVLVLIAISLANARRIIRKKFSYGAAAAALFAIAGITVSGLVLSPFVERAASRFTGVKEDRSALSRVKSFEIGNLLIADQPILGFGYNYVNEPARKMRGGKVGLDSSIQVFFASFGLPGSIVLIGVVCSWLWNVDRRLSSDRVFLYRGTVIYSVITVVFAGNFNQILFYPFWLVPVLAFLAYFHFLAYGGGRGMDGSGYSPISQTS
ncbi:MULTISPECIES: O-antigen ligase family protein [Stenotrophomonas]|uniref:O-antigen ligase-related domain-containing protein n=1 Tax=Stenotrophomonas maltophilia TaxID=40324 RepID=A0A3S0JPQ1_STEMA|nr:O-antigen ligase family protein [Stenotrophomonas maltophilia]RTQ91249.1 hypothetical protein EKL94_03750 [Stenotrophomonas maltophilia]